MSLMHGIVICGTRYLTAELSAGKVHIWVLRTVPNLADCFAQFVRSSIQKAGDEPGVMANGTFIK